MHLAPMLHRIGHHRRVTPTVDTLVTLHRAWRHSVPYENLDIQLGRPISLDPDAVFDKLIRRRRGGYCFEQNAGLAMMLRLAGFAVDLVEAGVQRETRGDAMWGNHSALIVTLDGERRLADAGIGDGFLDPLPLREGPHTQGGFTYRLERLTPGSPELHPADGTRETWRFHHHPGGSVASYDFRLRPCESADFAARSHELSTSPESAYVTTLMAARPTAGHTLLLLSRTLRTLGAGHKETRAIDTIDAFTATLAEDFLVPLDDLGPDGVQRLWERAARQDDLWRKRAVSDG